MSPTYNPQHKYDLLPSPVDHRDFRLEAPIDFSNLPSDYILPFTPPIRNQGAEGSCWGFAGTAAHEAGRLILGKGSQLLSPAYLYYATRKVMGDVADDTGSDIRTGLDALLHEGVCVEEKMPYAAGRWMDVPPPEALLDAVNQKIEAYHRLTMIHEIQAALAANMPVVFGIPVTQEFEQAQDGYVPMMAPTSNILGGHAILCIGYRTANITKGAVDGGGQWILQNSWGQTAGDGGRYYIPFAYPFNPMVQWAEAWALTA